ncbi:hypothetical protein HY383_03555 [Candidatus Daviesbacteria bacterium]|nr:hypothetical protein [Candidatus Daviesbacteria bacterium]
MIVSWYLIRNGLLNNLVGTILPLKFVAEFIAGMFYTSFLTSPISLAMLVVLAKSNNPFSLALLAGFGSALADIIIIKFFREGISSEINLVSHQLRFEKINYFLIKWKLTFLTPVVGALIVASPLPDELGLVMLGISKLKYYQIAIVTYVLNTAGILLIVMPVSLLK